MEIVIGLLVAIIGLAVGSFLNVVIYRIPQGKSVVWPASHCPRCEQPLAWYDNIPLVSFVWLRGRCRYCRQPISGQYPLVEVGSAFLLLVSWLKFDLAYTFIAASFFLLILLTVAVIDLQHQIIPNRIIIPAIIFAVFVVATSYLLRQGILPLVGRSSWGQSAIGFIIGGGLPLIIALVRPGGMGGGDVKLAAFMGIFLGFYVLMALFIGFLIGSIAGLISIAFFKKSRRDLLPFGPFLSLGAILTLFYGVEVFKWYTSFTGM